MKKQTTPKSVKNPLEVKNSIRKRLLLVSDVPERLQKLAARFGEEGIEMTRASSAEDIARACQRDHDIAVIDVSPLSLARVLRTLRESASLVQIPLLVEASRVGADPALAGLLPLYRAMACNLEEVTMLVRNCVARTASANRDAGRERRRSLF